MLVRLRLYGAVSYGVCWCFGDGHAWGYGCYHAAIDRYPGIYTLAARRRGCIAAPPTTTDLLVEYPGSLKQAQLMRCWCHGR